MLRVQKRKKLDPPQFTVLGWQVDDIAAKIKELVTRGVVFNHMDWILSRRTNWASGPHRTAALK